MRFLVHLTRATAYGFIIAPVAILIFWLCSPAGLVAWSAAGKWLMSVLAGVIVVLSIAVAVCLPIWFGLYLLDISTVLDKQREHDATSNQS